jgi:hypothetical protein
MEWDDDRMDIIGQNGNDGLHYEKSNKFKIAFSDYSTDKGFFHGYDEPYNKVFRDYNPSSLLEIGVGFDRVKNGRDIPAGASLRAWKQIWPKCKIEAIDIKEQEDLGFNIFVGNSTNIKLENNYDVIIDDGSHHWKDQLATIKNLYNNSNLSYVIEDIQGEYSLKKLLENIPEHMLENSVTFDSVGPIKSFGWGNIYEYDTNFKIMFLWK